VEVTTLEEVVEEIALKVLVGTWASKLQVVVVVVGIWAPTPAVEAMA
jgi:hypothetical protein